MTEILPAEPIEVYPEARFEEAVRRLMDVTLEGNVALIVPKFGLDFGVFVHGPSGCGPVFVEVKSYSGQRQGGVGFGNGKGEGPQVELLLSENVGILDDHVHWAFADATKPPGAARFALLNCSEAKAAVMGVVARGKQNNFNFSKVSSHLVSWQLFAERLVTFVLAAKGATA